MNRTVLALIGVATLARVIVAAAPSSRPGGEAARAINAGALPTGYRDWRLISVAREGGSLDDIRAVLGNDVAVEAYRAGTRPFPDGAVIARLAWSCEPSEENNRAFG